MEAEVFRCKTFFIAQSDQVAKVGTDAFLLGAWTPVPPGKVLDIGSGTGVIALIAAEKNRLAHIDAVDVNPIAAEIARQNFEANGFAHRTQSFATEIQQFYPDHTYDLILSNPPYFRPGHARLPEKPIRVVTRHGLRLTLEELARQVDRLLAPEGVFSVVLPPDEAGVLGTALANAGLLPFHILNIFTRPHKPVKRILCQYSRLQLPLTKEELIIHEGNWYTQAYQDLLRPYYLEF